MYKVYAINWIELNGTSGLGICHIYSASVTLSGLIQVAGWCYCCYAFHIHQPQTVCNLLREDVTSSCVTYRKLNQIHLYSSNKNHIITNILHIQYTYIFNELHKYSIHTCMFFCSKLYCFREVVYELLLEIRN